jgi:endonuclease/exonuclease/phosphatase family metal-dependent hydrolase
MLVFTPTEGKNMHRVTGLLAVLAIVFIASPTFAKTVRFASFNSFLNRERQGQLITDLSTPDNAQAQAVAEIIQRVNPDILLLKEFDYDPQGKAAQLFQKNYLAVSHNGSAPLNYPYVYFTPSNTGIASGADLDNDGAVDRTPGDRTYGGDAFGFGAFPGQYATLLYSKYPILRPQVRTFQRFLWKDMPGALLPDNPATPAPNDWYTPAELAVFRLSSKNHWDIPIEINSAIIHVLASHPTPPVFDGAEDRNGRRNHDEIRLWADYITPGKGDYIYDDAGQRGGLKESDRFVIMGDLNADPIDGDAYEGAIGQLLNNPLINTSITPSSEGGRLAGANDGQQGRPEYDTSSFPNGANYHLDYVLPSANLQILNSAVFWPPPNDPLRRLVGEGDPVVSSDHRLVWVDVEVPSGE